MKRELTTFNTFLPCSTFNTFFPRSYYTFATSLQCFHHVQHVPSTFLLYNLLHPCNVFTTSNTFLPRSYYIFCYILSMFSPRPTRSFHILITSLLHHCLFRFSSTHSFHVLITCTTNTFLLRSNHIFATVLPCSCYDHNVSSTSLLHICYIIA